MKLVEKLATRSDCYKANRRITVKGLMLHSVGCNQPDAAVFANTWNAPNWNVAAHAVIGTGGLVIQTLPWDWRGWHGGGSSNDTHIGVEMTEPSTIKYTTGANWQETGDGSNTRKHVLDTYQTAVELFAMLCEKYKLNPKADGVIVSHSEGYKRGIASGHADVEHLWRTFGLSMDKFRDDVSKELSKLSGGESTGVSKPDTSPKEEIKVDKGKETYHTVVSGDTLSAISAKYGVSVGELVKLNGIKDANKIYVGQKIKLRDGEKSTAPSEPSAGVSSDAGKATDTANPQTTPTDKQTWTPIAGESIYTENQLMQYAKDRGVSDDYAKLVPIYLEEGRKEGIRGDVAFAQSLLETGNFKFGGDVSANQNNFAGLGATGNGVSGEVFGSPTLGIIAQIQHLKAYANTEPLTGEVVDTRFKYVERGIAPYIEWLGIPDNPHHKGWAAAKGYGESILKILKWVSEYPRNSKDEPQQSSADGLYVVRLRFDDIKSQIGAFKNLDYAKKLVDERKEYKVFDDKGIVVYEVTVKQPTYSADKAIEPYIIRVSANTNVYSKPDSKSDVSVVIDKAGKYTIVAENKGYGKLKSGAGYVDLSDVDKEEPFRPYLVSVTAAVLNIRDVPNGSVVGQIADKGTYTIVEQKNNWGKLKSGAGWICLDFTIKTK